jgi:hypothetical protein
VQIFGFLLKLLSSFFTNLPGSGKMPRDQTLVEMLPTRSKNIWLIALAAILVAAVLLLALHYLPGSDVSSRQELLRFIPADSAAVFFFDLEELRASAFVEKLNAWAPISREDSEYLQFVRDTGFSYERDLQRAVVAIYHHQATTNLLAVVDGKFDRRKIEAFLTRSGKSTRQGKWKVFHLNASANEKPISVVFLSNTRVAVSDSESISAALSSAEGEAGRAEWNQHFERLAGSPLFAIVRQDAATQALLNETMPGSFRSPELSALLNQLQWISIAGKPDGDQLQVVAEGESLSPSVPAQLHDFFQGIILLAQNGLNDPELRQKMNPEERHAYLEILKNADIRNVDRGDWKSVRVVLEITPNFLEVARAASIAAPANEPSIVQQTPKPEPVSGKSKTHSKK